MKRKGMTLVELLIVIGIIAVLAGLLFPVFTSVRERARITYCINNLKQVGAALHMYAQDHDGFVPPYTLMLLIVVISFLILTIQTYLRLHIVLTQRANKFGIVH
jgi:prepilin-type N-terminal cleavage/methylation domain-containing protein